MKLIKWPVLTGEKRADILLCVLLAWAFGFPTLFAAAGWRPSAIVLLIYGAGIFVIGVAIHAAEESRFP